MTQEVAREKVRRRIVRIALVSSIGLALVSLLLFLASQPRQAFAKTNSPGVLRQTGTGAALSITGTTGMNNVDREAMGHAMSHLIMALDTLHEMQQQHMSNAATLGGALGDMGSTAGTTDTTGTAGMGIISSGADVGALIEMLGHMAESMGYMHEAMGYSTMGATDMAGTGDAMNGAWSDLGAMLDILDQMVQATTGQLPTLRGMPGATATGTTTATAATSAMTGTTGTGAQAGSFDTAVMLPAMAQTLQSMADQLRGMTGATDTGATDTTTATAGMGSDMMGSGTPTVRYALQSMGQAMELMGHMQMMMATLTGPTDVGMTGTASAGTGGDMLGLINAMAQAMADHISIMSAPLVATAAPTDTAETGAASTMTATPGMTDTIGMTGTTGSDSLGVGSTNPTLNATAQLLHTLLLQIQGLTGGIDGGAAQ